MHAQYAGGTPSNADCATYANGFRAAFATRYTTLLPSTVQYTTFEVIDLATLTGAIGSNTTAITGTAASSATVPNSACQVVSWKIALRYRGGHPRTYFPYSSSTALINGVQLPAATVTALQTASNSFITDLNAITSGTLIFSFAAVSYWQHKLMRPVGVPFLITAAQVHNRVDTQRRRLGKEF